MALGHKLHTALRLKTLSVECPFNSGLIVKQHFNGVSLLALVKSRALYLVNKYLVWPTEVHVNRLMVVIVKR